MSLQPNKGDLMSTDKQQKSFQHYISLIGDTLPIITIVFFSTYYYFTTKFADIEQFNELSHNVTQVEKDISLLQKEDISYGTRLEILDQLEQRLRECERKVNLLITKDDRPIPSDASIELKGEIAILKMLIESIRDDIKATK